jgi:hypothetical protein
MHLEILRRLDISEFIFEAVRYILEHPKRELNGNILHGKGETNKNGFAIVVGQEPEAKATHDEDVIALLVTSRNGVGYEKVVFLHGDEVRRGITYRAWRDADDEE